MINFMLTTAIDQFAYNFTIYRTAEIGVCDYEVLNISGDKPIWDRVKKGTIFNPTMVLRCDEAKSLCEVMYEKIPGYKSLRGDKETIKEQQGTISKLWEVVHFLCKNVSESKYV